MDNDHKGKEFIKQSSERHKGAYDYSLVRYIDAKTEVEIICKAHNWVFKKSPDKHKNARQGCQRCSKRYRWKTEEWIAEAREVHEGRYGYDKVIYKKATENVQIYCYTCERYFPQTPDTHLNQGSGCPQCGGNLPKTHDEWEIAARIKHRNKYQYLSRYIDALTPVEIFCPIHGRTFPQLPNKHLKGGEDGRGQGCPDCGRVSQSFIQSLGIKEFLRRSNIIHQNRYNYSKVKFVNTKQDVVIICPEHGEFPQSPGAHLYQQQGCPDCAVEIRYFSGQWLKDYRKSGKYNEAIFYVIECKSDYENFLKVGISKKKSVYDRYPNKGSMPYTWEPLLEESMELADAWEREKRILRELSQYRINAKIPFPGRTECLRINSVSRSKLGL